MFTGKYSKANDVNALGFTLKGSNLKRASLGWCLPANRGQMFFLSYFQFFFHLCFGCILCVVQDEAVRGRWTLTVSTNGQHPVAEQGPPSSVNADIKLTGKFKKLLFYNWLLSYIKITDTFYLNMTRLEGCHKFHIVCMVINN